MNTIQSRCSVLDCHGARGNNTDVGRCDRHDALLTLAHVLDPATTIYTITRHVSRTGRSVVVGCYVRVGDGAGGMVDISAMTGVSVGLRWDGMRQGVVVTGEGLGPDEAGEQVVRMLAKVLWPQGCQGDEPCLHNQRL